MTNRQAQHQLTIKRYLEGGKTSAAIRCPAGRIIVLSDESGVELRLYQQALAKVQQSGPVSFEYDGRPLQAEDWCSVGFEDPMPDESISQYLMHCGLTPEAADEVLVRFELKKQSFLLCSQLPLLPARQVQLLAALARGKRILVLSDPFLPFNGRWREAFGELVLKECREKQLIAVCINLSFIPTCWAQQKELTEVDVGRAAEEALERMVKAAQPPKPADDLDRAVAAAERNDKYYRPAIKIPLPENVVFAYKEVCDWIFEPLARVSNFLRQWSALTSVTVIVLMVVLGAVVMFPNLASSRQMLVAIAAKFSEPAKLPQVTEPPPAEVKKPEQPAPVLPDAAKSVTEQPDAEAPERAVSLEEVSRLVPDAPFQPDLVEEQPAADWRAEPSCSSEEHMSEAIAAALLFPDYSEDMSIPEAAGETGDPEAPAALGANE